MTGQFGKSPEKPPHGQSVLFLKMNLQEQIKLVDSLVQAARAKREAILARQLQKIEEAVVQESKLMEQLESLEDRRSTWIQQWASARSISKETFLLSDVIPTLSTVDADDVQAIAENLVERLNELDEINRENAGLVFHSLAHVRMLLNAIGDVEPEGRVYGPSAASPNRPKRGIVEWRA